MSPQILLWEGEILNQKVNFKKVSIQLSVIQDKPGIQMDESLMKNWYRKGSRLSSSFE